jgi:hypothetical protein
MLCENETIIAFEKFCRRRLAMPRVLLVSAGFACETAVRASCNSPCGTRAPVQMIISYQSLIDFRYLSTNNVKNTEFYHLFSG